MIMVVEYLIVFIVKTDESGSQHETMVYWEHLNKPEQKWLDD